MQVSHKMAKQVSTGCFRVQVHRVFGMWPQRVVLRHPRPDSTSEHSLLFSEKLFMFLWLFLYNSMAASIKTSQVNYLAVKTVLLLHYYCSIKTSFMVWNTASTVQLTSISIVWIYYQPLLQQILTNSSFSSVSSTHLVFLRISSTSCLMWSSMNSIFSCFRARAFCRRTMRSTSTVLSTSG